MSGGASRVDVLRVLPKSARTKRYVRNKTKNSQLYIDCTYILFGHASLLSCSNSNIVDTKGTAVVVAETGKEETVASTPLSASVVSRNLGL